MPSTSNSALPVQRTQAVAPRQIGHAPTTHVRSRHASRVPFDAARTAAQSAGPMHANRAVVNSPRPAPSPARRCAASSILSEAPAPKLNKARTAQQFRGCGIALPEAAAVDSPMSDNSVVAFQAPDQCVEALRRLGGDGPRDHYADRLVLLIALRSLRRLPWPASAGLSSSSPTANDRARHRAECHGHRTTPTQGFMIEGFTIENFTFQPRSASSGPDKGVRSTSSRLLRAACNCARICSTSSSACVAMYCAPSCSRRSVAPSAAPAQHAAIVDAPQPAALGCIAALACDHAPHAPPPRFPRRYRLQRQHSLAGEFAAGSRLRDLTAIAIERKCKADVEWKFRNAVIPVVTG